MAGLKYSRQREAVADYLRSTTSHPTAEQIYVRLREDFPKISLGTIYRNLNLLVKEGEIIRLNCGDGVERFDATTQPHHHFICRKCGSVLDLDLAAFEELDREANQNFSGEIQGHEIYFYGTCPDCL